MMSNTGSRGNARFKVKALTVWRYRRSFGIASICSSLRDGKECICECNSITFEEDERLGVGGQGAEPLGCNGIKLARRNAQNLNSIKKPPKEKIKKISVNWNASQRCRSFRVSQEKCEAGLVALLELVVQARLSSSPCPVRFVAGKKRPKCTLRIVGWGKLAR
jgi:hypothetical protein